MRSDVRTFKRALLFVVLTIRQQLVTVPEQLEQVEQGDLSPLFGFKIRSHDYIAEHGEELWRNVKDASTRVAMLHLLSVPGLGIVKAGFVLQLLGHDVACLDSRNVKREKRNPRAFRTDGKPAHKLTRKVDRYLVEVSGRACELWDAWCSEVAEAYKLTAEEISALHLAPLAYDLAETF